MIIIYFMCEIYSIVYEMSSVLSLFFSENYFVIRGARCLKKSICIYFQSYCDDC